LAKIEASEGARMKLTGFKSCN